MRDAAISVVGSFLLALLVMWVVELFNRTDPQPTMLVPHPVAVSMLGGQIAERAALPGYAMPALDATATGLLTAEPSLPRELVTEEIGSLMAAATEDVRLAVLLLVGGLSPEELVALQWDDVDLAARQIRAPGDSPRTIDLFEPAPTLLARLPQAAGNRVLQAHGNGPITLERLTSDLLYAAHDAGIDHPAEVTPAALRHTYVAFLARQGIRLADLVTLVGRLSPDQAAAYSALSPPGRRLALAEVKRVLPGLSETGPA
jgi:integrase